MNDPDLQFGVMAGFPDPESARATVEQAERLGFDSLWVGDHVAFPVPILDSLTQLALAAAFARRLTLGTCVYLLPLRHPTLVAKQTATLDRMLSGRFVLGVGVGGEFPNEYAACGVPLRQRGARLTEGIDVLKALWSGEPVTRNGRFFPLDDVRMLPPPTSPGGPPIWCGGRAKGALERAGRIGDGYVSYAVDPQRFSESLTTIRHAAAAMDRSLDAFTPAHMLFLRLDERFEDSHRTATEHLSRRYAMDFSKAARRYGALGSAADVAETIHRYREAGVQHVILDLVGPAADRDEQLHRFSREVRPLLNG
ncbi:MAG: LLM class flavin-dependent oxidoreductase [Pseudomonadales bacterium]